ncbi:MAG: EAL domain-containing protein [Gammaproteobacteria bacterium]|nr:EAL domain-containing protein [Gammaproteobacteria bacterium]
MERKHHTMSLPTPTKSEFSHIRSRFYWGVILSLTLTSVCGYQIAWIAGQFDDVTQKQLLAAAASAILVVAALYFHGYLNPFNSCWEKRPERERMNRRLVLFPLMFWGFMLTYVIGATLIYHVGSAALTASDSYIASLQFGLIQLLAAIFIGLPGYFYALNKLGRLITLIDLNSVQVSLKSKLMLLGGFLPLLTSATLMGYDHWSTHANGISISTETVLVWTALGLITVLATLLSIRGFSQSLQPVQDVLHVSGASSHRDLAQLRPQSNDEIGYLTQMLGRLFRRLTDQSAQVHAIIDTAAEGIIVVDEEGLVDTFNLAAEQLFGYRAQEVRSTPLLWLLPSLISDSGAPRLVDDEQELEAIRKDGKKVPVSVRVSQFQHSGKTLYSCLVADISQRKAAEDKLVNAEGRYRDLVETAHDLVWSLDANCRWSYLNAASKEIYGYEPEEMLNKKLTDFIFPQYAEKDAVAFADLINGKELVQYETIHVDRNNVPHNLSFSARAHFDDGGNVLRITGTARDITKQKAFEKQLAYQAEHDALTGLFNRRYFQQELERLSARVARAGAACAIFYIDLDQFKYINDTLGHAAGDRLLVECAGMIGSHIREGDLLARFGGDEFTILLYNVDQERAMRVAEHLRSMFENYKFLDDGKAFNVTCSIGVAMIDNDSLTADECLSHADIACNVAKSRGRNQANLYNPNDRDQDGMAEDMGWAARVRETLEADRMQIVYQPIVATKNRVINSYEVLMRMRCEDGTIILPGGFLPAAERFGLIHSLDRWMVTQSITRLGQLHAANQRVHFAINLSGRAFEDATLLPLIRELLQDSAIDPSTLTFEITETATIANLSAAVKFIGNLKDIGCNFALDDFGSGFSSFYYLKHLPVDKLKIDGSFVQGLADAPVDQAMVQSINQVAHALGKETVAECVENEETLKLLTQFGVDYVQGYHVGKPMESIGIPITPPLSATLQ